MSEIKIHVECIGEWRKGEKNFAIVCRNKSYIKSLEEKCSCCGDELDICVKLFNEYTKTFDKYVCSQCLPGFNNGKGLPETSIFNS